MTDDSCWPSLMPCQIVATVVVCMRPALVLNIVCINEAMRHCGQPSSCLLFNMLLLSKQEGYEFVSYFIVKNNQHKKLL